MAKHTIEIIVKPGGEIETEVQGVEGSSCRDISRWLDLLGKVIHHGTTKDMLKNAKQEIKQRIGV